MERLKIEQMEAVRQASIMDEIVWQIYEQKIMIGVGPSRHAATIAVTTQ